VHLDCGYRVDLLVEDKLIVELKSVEQIKGDTSPREHVPKGIHEAQLLTYVNTPQQAGGY